MSSLDHLSRHISKYTGCTCRILRGYELAATIKNEIKALLLRIEQSDASRGAGHPPGFGIVFVDDEKEWSFVKLKGKVAKELGISFFPVPVRASISQDEIKSEVEQLNADPRVHGILIQLPLPSHLNPSNILAAVSPEKDVDGLTPSNLRALFQLRSPNDIIAAKGEKEEGGETKPNTINNRALPIFVPCTPRACLEFLDREGIDVNGKTVAVLVREDSNSNTNDASEAFPTDTGRVVAQLLRLRGAQVQVCPITTTTSSSTSNNEADYETITKRADIVISAANRLNLITARSIKNGAIVIDAGNNACVVDGAKSVVVGDVAVLDTDDDYDDSGKRVSGSVGNVASCVVPMPGGLGPVTVSLLMRNTLDAYIRSRYPDRDFNLRTRQLIRCNK